MRKRARSRARVARDGVWDGIRVARRERGKGSCWTMVEVRGELEVEVERGKGRNGVSGDRSVRTGAGM